MSRSALTSSGSTRLAHSRRVTLASGLIVLLAVVNIVGPLMPKSDGNLVFGIVSALIAVVAAWGLSTVRRWGRGVSIVVAVLNMLSDGPGVAVGSTLLMKAMAGATVLCWAAVLALVARPQVLHPSPGE